MRFEDFTPAERRILLHALDREIQWFVGRLNVPIEPDHWQACHEEIRRQRRADMEVVKCLRGELSRLVVIDLNS